VSSPQVCVTQLEEYISITSSMIVAARGFFFAQEAKKKSKHIFRAITRRSSYR
jgi:hypothetical protein